MLIPVAVTPATPAVLDEDLVLLLDAVGSEEAAQKAAVGSVTLALYCIHISPRPSSTPSEARNRYS